MWHQVKNTLLIYKPSCFDVNITDELIDNIMKDFENKCDGQKKQPELPNEISDVVNENGENDDNIILTPLDTTNIEKDDFLLNQRSICSFDFDSTLVCQKSGSKFPTDENDWKLQYANVESALYEEYNQNGNMIVIFSNQSGVEKNKLSIDTVKGRFENFLNSIEIPIWCFIALGNDHFRKPNTTMWNIMLGIFEKQIQDHSNKLYNENTKIQWDIKNSLYVGDAAGRKKECFSKTEPKRSKDFACSDRKFAYNIGIDFKTPEEYFLDHEQCDGSSWEWGGFDPSSYILENNNFTFDLSEKNPLKSSQEIVIVVGPPSCGKSTFCSNYFPNHTRINMDTLKTKAKCLKMAKEALQKGQSVIIDNTNGSAETRKEYVDMCNILSNPFNKKMHTTKCIFFDIKKDLALHLNNLRVKMTNGEIKKIPDIAYNVYYKNFVEPSASEGFDFIYNIPFVLNFKNNLHRKQFMERNET